MHQNSHTIYVTVKQLSATLAVKVEKPGIWSDCFGLVLGQLSNNAEAIAQVKSRYPGLRRYPDGAFTVVFT